MSGSGSNHEYYYPQAAPTSTNGGFLHDFPQPEYTSNTFPQQDQYWSSTVPHQPAPQAMSQPYHNLPPPSTHEAVQLSEARATSSGKPLRRLLPALPSHEPQHKNNHSYSTQGNIVPSHSETSMTPWPSHRPTAQLHHSNQATILPQVLTLNPPRTNTENHLSASPSPMNISPQKSISTRSSDLLRCTWPNCQYEGTFNRPKDLERHMETQHTNKSSHECHFEDCDSTYNRKDNLTAHLRRKHSSR